MAKRIGIVGRDLWGSRRELGRILDGEPVRMPWPGRVDVILGPTGRAGAAARALAALVGATFRPVRIGPLGFVRPGDPPMSLEVGGLRSGPVLTDDAAGDLALFLGLRLSLRNDGRDRLLAGLADGFDLIGTEGGTAPPPGGRAQFRVLDHRDNAHRRGSDPGIDPWLLVATAARIVASADSDLGALAQLAGRDLVTPSGGTIPAPDEAGQRRLFVERFLDGPIYLDAWSREPTDFATAAGQLAWLRDRFRDNDRRAVCVGVSRWKRRQVARFLDGPDGPARFVASSAAAVSAAGRTGRVVAWETRMPARLEADCAAAGVPLVRMEDGFLRSVGLGASFLPGASAVLDGRGIYYDPRRPSDLEHILAEADFDPDIVARAEALRRDVVALRLSKYNVGRPAALDDLPTDRMLVLVPGQVEDDASVMLGSPAVRGNLALLQAARRRSPGAYLLFKPHPDVAAGLRQGRVDEAEALRHADRIVGDVPIVDLLDLVDEVDTMTSLTGFEALIRGRRVAVHGRPFYAGWGLTLDLDPPPGRTSRLGLDELVAGALILYPRYIDPRTGLRCPPEVLVRHLAAARDAAQAKSPSGSTARAGYVRARHALLGPPARAIRRLRGAVRSAPPPDRDRA